MVASYAVYICIHIYIYRKRPHTHTRTHPHHVGTAATEEVLFSALKYHGKTYAVLQGHMHASLCPYLVGAGGGKVTHTPASFQNRCESGDAIFCRQISCT